jgi:hypothetical protein
MIIPKEFAVRDFEARDTSFVVDSWRASGEKPFLLGEYQPFQHFDKTISDAIKVSNFKLLKRIYHSEIGRIMNRAILNGKIQVLCDVADSRIIFGWKSIDPPYHYIKQIVRGYTGDF